MTKPSILEKINQLPHNKRGDVLKEIALKTDRTVRTVYRWLENGGMDALQTATVEKILEEHLN